MYTADTSMTLYVGQKVCGFNFILRIKGVPKYN